MCEHKTITCEMVRGRAGTEWTCVDCKEPVTLSKRETGHSFLVEENRITIERGTLEKDRRERRVKKDAERGRTPVPDAVPAVESKSDVGDK